jgi:tetratricopeptide (TPR) repeat protein
LEGKIVRKLTFERAVVVVFALIILISTSDMINKFYYKYIDTYLTKNGEYNIGNSTDRVTGMPNALAKANELFKTGEYEEAANEYLAVTMGNTLSIEQKSHAYFNLGVCNYHLNNYDLALDSFERAIVINPSDSLAYNNAAVSAYRSRDLIKAIQMQQKALAIKPAVEYYYNLARMYEDNEQYDMAAENYLQVAIGERNLSRTERIDPVRVKERIARLMPRNQFNGGTVNNTFLIAYKLNDTRDVFTINENEMEIKETDFIVQIEDKGSAKNIVVEYDKQKNDPYNLISQLVWTIYKDGKQIYMKNGEKIVTSVRAAGNYEIKLSIKQSGNKEIIATKNVNIQESQATIDKVVNEEIIIKPTPIEDSKLYSFAVYEQLFENDFNISNNGYTDKYNVVWGKDEGAITSLNKKLAVDKAGSLNISNSSQYDAGLWVNLDSLLYDSDIRGKSVSISFYGREIAENSIVNVSVRVNSNNVIATSQKDFKFPFKFSSQSIRVYIPEDATGFTISIKTRSGGEFNIDAFTIVD